MQFVEQPVVGLGKHIAVQLDEADLALDLARGLADLLESISLRRARQLVREGAQPRRVVGVERAADRGDATLEVAEEPQHEVPHLGIVGKSASQRPGAAFRTRCT